MSELIKDIKNYFIAQSIDSIGNIFLDTIPDAPDSCIAISEYGGEPGPGFDIDARRIQVLIRNTNYSTGKTKINAIRNLLDSTSPEQIVSLAGREAVFFAIQTPFKLKEDERKRIYFVCNFRVITVRD